MLGRRPLIAADIGVVVLPVMEPGVADTTVPYEVVRPYSKEAVAVEVFGLIVPFSVAPEEVTDVAAVVTTVGGFGSVVKVMSFPYTISPPDVTPLALK